MSLNNQRGLSLVEVLGAIVIIGVILTMLGTIVLQASRNTRDNELSDRAVNITRNFAEELKYTVRNLNVQNQPMSNNQQLQIPDTNSEVMVFVNLQALWNTGYKETKRFPSEANHQYTIDIEFTHVASDGSLTIPNPYPTEGTPASVIIDTQSGFRKAIITATSIVTGKTYKLESLIDY